MKLALVIAILFGMSGIASAEFRSEDGTYFEPTKQEQSENSEDIQWQQELYEKSKNAKNYYGARKSALFHFQLAWLYNNEAYYKIKEYQDPKKFHALYLIKLKETQELIHKGLEHVAAARRAGHHMNEVRQSEIMLNRNLTAINTLIAIALED